MNRRRILQAGAAAALFGPRAMALGPGVGVGVGVGTAPSTILQPWKFGTCSQFYRTDRVTASGGFVDTWTDRTANALDLTQAGAPRPAFNVTDTDYGGRGSLSITGSQYLDAAAHAVSQPTTWSFVAKCTAASGIVEIVDDVVSGQIIQIDMTNNLVRLFAGSLGFVGASPLGSPFWLVCEFNGAASKVWLNGTSLSSTLNAGAGAVGRLRAFANSTPAAFWRGTCAEMGLWSGAWTAAQLTDMKHYVKDYYNGRITTGV